MDLRLKPLFEAATRPYLAAGKHAWLFARGKLRYDPVYFGLLHRGLLPERGSLLDLGCGQGMLLSLLRAAKHQPGAWPDNWPSPPSLVLRGIDSSADRASTARRALGRDAQVDHGDACDLDFEPCSVIVMLDVLFYLGEADQARLMDKAAAALEPNGLLLVREPDAGAGVAFGITKWSERLACALRGSLRPRLHYRSAAQWIAEFSARGLRVDATPMSKGTPFANILFVARKVPSPSA